MYVCIRKRKTVCPIYAVVLALAVILHFSCHPEPSLVILSEAKDLPQV